MDESKTENITVGVRIRPLNSRENSAGFKSIWQTVSQNTIKERTGLRSFTFDQVYTESTDTYEIFRTQCSPVIEKSIAGYNGCIFCYGQTGSGKTFTMHGIAKQKPGVTPISIDKIFSIIHHSSGKEFLIRCSYIELYNEVINDLLNPACSNLQLAEDKKSGIKILGVTEEVCTSFNQVNSLLIKGENHKNVASTNFNQRSSRSHSVYFIERFRIIIENKNAVGRPDVTIAALNLIDLAGSESANVHGPASSSLRSREMKYINRSLLTLGTVIMRLSTKKNKTPIPYRDSKLTRLLQPALEGNSKVSIICNISPSSDAYEETLSTLKFAQRAKLIKQTITKSEVPTSKALIMKYQQEIQDLQDKLKEMEIRLASEETAAREITLNSQLMLLQEEKEKADAKLEEILQEKLRLAHDLERLKAFIISAENVKPTKLFSHINESVFEADMKEQRGGSIGNWDRELEVEVKDRRGGSIGPWDRDLEADLKRSQERRDTLLFKGIDNIELELEMADKKLTLEECYSIIREQNKIIEDYEEALLTKDKKGIEESGNLIKIIEEKEEEIEVLKDELQLCRNNLTQIQMMNRLIKKGIN